MSIFVVIWLVQNSLDRFKMAGSACSTFFDNLSKMWKCVLCPRKKVIPIFEIATILRLPNGGKIQLVLCKIRAANVEYVSNRIPFTAEKLAVFAVMQSQKRHLQRHLQLQVQLQVTKNALSTRANSFPRKFLREKLPVLIFRNQNSATNLRLSLS